MDSVFENNKNPTLNEPGIIFIKAKSTVMDNCIFNGNFNNNDIRVSSDYGFVITCFSIDVVFRNSNITKNFDYTIGFGNTIALHGENISVFNCSFENNTQIDKNVASYTGVLHVDRLKGVGRYDGARWDICVADIDGCSFKIIIWKETETGIRLLSIRIILCLI